MTFDFDTYIKKIQEDLRRGNATEHTYRSALEALIESFGKGIEASNDPKHIECGAPDFIVEKGKVPLGYVETKDIGVDLDKIEKTDQMKRYLKALNNLILTDYLEFRWYVNGEKRLTLHLATPVKNKVVVNPLGAQNLEQMFRDFFLTEAPTVNTPKELATRLAEVTHFIKDRISEALEGGDNETRQALEGQYKVFVELLLPALTHKEFADLYAQTVTYGLFAAKMVAEEQETERIPFTLESATLFLRRIPFLRRLFQDVNEQLDEIDLIRPYLKDIVSLLNRSRMDEILADFGQRTHTEDPVVHFYETFLSVYDPKMRESRGVYYTPEPVVQFIVRSVDEVLKTRFGKPWGLADESVKVLDPATGTGTFLYYVIQQIHEEIVNVRGQGGQWQEKSKDMLKRLYGFELLIAPYVISHLKLGLLMEHLGAPLEGKDERMHVYLTNTLEEGLQRKELLPGLGYGIAEESSEAAKVKQADDIMVVLGNPPYSNFGMMNKGEWITGLLREYKNNLKEKKLNLDDDFIKFIRYGQYLIEKTGQGVISFITNNTFIDGITHRVMRYSLLNSFSEIYILNLHGSSKRQENNPKIGIDENVFDIQQGVSVSIFIKSEKSHNKLADVYYVDLWGTRAIKYKYLCSTQYGRIDWELVKPENPDYFFMPKDFSLSSEYQNYISLNYSFYQSSSGIQTKRDDVAVSFSREDLKATLRDFASLDSVTIRAKYRLPEDGRDWTIPQASEHAKITLKNEKHLSPLLYRPFDHRWTVIMNKSKGFVAYPRYETMRNMRDDNLGLIVTRQLSSKSFQHAFVTDSPIDGNTISLQTREYSYLFPLYIYENKSETEKAALLLFEQFDSSKHINITTETINSFGDKLNLLFVDNKSRSSHQLNLGIASQKSLAMTGKGTGTFTAENVFHYIYAILHSPTYRKRYSEFLKIDFPRVPLTSDKELFFKLAELGGELVDLHLLKSAKVNEFITTYPVSGSNKVEKVIYSASREDAKNAKGSLENKVYINSTQYFGGVPESVWEFKIGGYQVCDKWLKDRKGRMLSAEDISHYQRVVVALHETMRLMSEIDAAIPKWPVE